MVPTFTQQSIGQGGAQLYSGSIATPTPQTFGVASPPLELDGFGVDDGPCWPAVTRCTPAHIRQVGAGFAITELHALVHYPLHLLASPDRPALSGSTSTPRLRQGRLPPFPALPGSGCPQASPGRCDGPAEKVSHPPSITQRLVAHSSAAKKTDAAFKISFARRNSRTSARNFRRSADS